MPRGIPKSGKRNMSGKRGPGRPPKAAAKRGRPKTYATPARYVKKVAAQKKATGKRGRPRKEVTKPVTEVHSDMALLSYLKQLVEIQRAAFLDNFRHFYLKSQGTAQQFAETFSISMPILDVSLQDLEDAIAEFKEEKEPSLSQEEQQAIHTEGNSAANLDEDKDDLNIL